MDHRLTQYVEITGRIRSGQRFCEFLAAGGTVWEQPAGASWRDITAEAMERELRKVEALERLRSRLYPDLAAEDEARPAYN